MVDAQTSRELPYPNLLVVGFVKCGTTSLAKYLSDHPMVASPAAKELYYLIDERSDLQSMRPIINEIAFGAERVAESERYINFFPDRGGRRYAIDATPFYYSQEAALEYAALHPAVQVVFLVRSPERRLASSFQYFQNVFQEYPNGSFDTFVDALLDDGAKRERYRNKIKKPFFRKLFDDELEMGNYEKHISMWAGRIGNERLFIGQAELMGDRPRDFMESICKFLNIDHSMYETYEFRSYMRSYKVRIPLLQKIGRRLGREDPIRYDRLTEFQSPFHRIPIPWLRRACDAAYGAMQHRSSDDSFSPEAMRRLRTYYDQPNRRLKALYGIDYLSAVPNRRIRANERPDAGVAAAIPGA